MSFTRTLSRDEMKNVKAGVVQENCSNIYCRIGGEQTWMGSSCTNVTLGIATENCIGTEELFGHTCGGCAEFT